MSIGKLSRREFLSITWLGVAALGLVKLAVMLGESFLPRRSKGSFGGEFEAGTLAELPIPDDPPLAYPEGRFWLVRTEKGLVALHRACTHLDCLVSWDETAQQFMCPCHGSIFDRDGNCLQGPASRPLDRFPVRVVTPEGQVAAQSDAAGILLVADTLLGAEAESAVAVESLVMVDTGRRILVRSYD